MRTGKRLFKRVIAIALTVALVVGILPYYGGKILKAVAAEKVDSYDRLVEVLTAANQAQDQNPVEILLGKDIEIKATLTFNADKLFTINGGTEKYTLTAADGFTGPLMNIEKGTVVLKSLSIEDSSISKGNTGDAVLIKNGAISTLILDEATIIDNIVRDDIITNAGKLYLNNSTIVGNKTIGSPSKNPSTIRNTNEAYVLNTTIAGNDMAGVTSSKIAKVVNSIVVSNFYSDKELDLVFSEMSNSVAYSLYGTIGGEAQDGQTDLVNSIKKTDADKHIFNQYQKNSFKPLVYKGVAFLQLSSPEYRDYGTITYFDYSNKDKIISGYATYEPEKGQKNVPLTNDITADDCKEGNRVKYYQNGVLRPINRGTQAAVGSANADNGDYCTLTIKAPKNGKIEGNTEKVYKKGQTVTLNAIPTEPYRFVRWVDETNPDNIKPAGKTAQTSFQINQDLVLSASFAKLSSASISLTVDGTPWAGQRVELYQFGSFNQLDYSEATHTYKKEIFTGDYSIYVNEEDTGEKLTVGETESKASVEYSSVKYDSGEGSGTLPKTQYVVKNSEIQLPEKGNLSLGDHNFIGWVVQGDLSGQVYAPGANYKVTAGTTFVAKWVPQFAEGSVTVNLNNRPSGDFTVAFKNRESGKTYNAAFNGSKYVATVENNGTYEILVNQEVVEVLPCDELTNKIYNYFTVTYHGNGNDDGQSELKKMVRGDTEYTLINCNYAKTGNKFKGWNMSELGSGTTKNPGDKLEINKKTDFYAMWDVQKYRVDFDVASGNELDMLDKERYIGYDSRYGSVGDLPIPTRTGYNFVYWTYNGSPVYNETIMDVATNHTLVAKWEPKILGITYPQGDGLKFKVVSTSGVFTAEYDSNFSFKIEPNAGYSTANAVVSVYDSTASDIVETTLTPVDGVYTIEKVNCDKTIKVSGVEDTLAPEINIEIKESKWSSFLNTITFGKFFKETQDVRITANDPGVGVDVIKYYVGEPMSLEDLKAVDKGEWTEIRNADSFKIEPNKRLVVYALAQDTAGNFAYVCSDGLVLDNVAPVIQGINADGLYELEEDKTYIAPITVRVTEENMGTVTVDGVEREVLENGEVLVAGSDKPVRIIATDLAGNSSEKLVNVMASTSVPDGNITDKVTDKSGMSAGVKTPSDKLQEMLITPEDKYAIDCGENINILVRISGEEAVPEDDRAVAESETENRGLTLAKLMDISILKEFLSHGTYNAIHQTPEALTFVFNIPAELMPNAKNIKRTFYIGRVHGADKDFMWLTDLDDSDETITIETDKFSTYVVAYEDETAEVPLDPAAPDKPNADKPADPANPEAPTNPNTPVVPNADPTAPSENPSVAPEGNEGTATDTEKKPSGSNGGIDTGDHTPIILAVILVIIGGVGFFFFDKKRKEARDDEPKTKPKKAPKAKKVSKSKKPEDK